MKCSRCQADLPDSATFCPTCGTSTQRSQPGFSYLPVGTPPWPATVPSRNTYNPQAPISSPPSGSSNSKEPKRRRSAGSVLFAIAAILLVPIVGILATLGTLYIRGDFAANAPSATHVNVPAPSSTQASPTTAASPAAGQATPGATTGNSSTSQGNQLPTPTSQRTISNPDLNLTLKYPSTWVTEPTQKSSDSTSVGFHPQQQLGIVFIAIRFSDAASATIHSPDEINQSNIQTLGNDQSITNVQIVPSSNQQPKIGGDTWKQQDAILQNTSGSKIHLITIAVQHKKEYYNLLISSPDVVYNEAMQKYLQPMLNSLQFLS